MYVYVKVFSVSKRLTGIRNNSLVLDSLNWFSRQAKVQAHRVRAMFHLKNPCC